MSKSLYNERKMLDDAYKNGYAVGAFNFSSIEVMRAIVDAAEIANSPVIIAMSQSGIKFTQPEYICDVMKAVLENTSVPISLHLDHGKDYELIKRCVKAGFNSIMIDGSYLPYKENVAITKKVVKFAHDHGVEVEGELGTLSGTEDDTSSDKILYTNPNQAAEFVGLTGVDSLAIAIGTSHGAYKFKAEPTLRFDILQEVSNLLPKFPIVLHGASNVPADVLADFNKWGGKMEGAKGVPEELLKKASKMAVCKINCDTDVRLRYTACIRQYLIEHPECFTPREYLQFAKDNLRDMIVDKMTNIMGSAGFGGKK